MYFAFFLDGTYYCNNTSGLQSIRFAYSVTDRGTEYDGYRYMISYEIYFAFGNNLSNPQDGPYAFVQIMSYTPGENTDGYEDAVGIVKDEGTMSERTLLTDKCSSCEFRANGVVAKPENETE